MEKRLKKFLIPILRKMWLRWPARTNVIKQSRVERGSYKCNICKQVGFSRTDLHVDHISPVINPEEGFSTWDEYIARLYVTEEELQVCCKTCHEHKTLLETKMRSYYKNSKKKS